MGVAGCWCAPWSSKPVRVVSSCLGGFDSHMLPPENYGDVSASPLFMVFSMSSFVGWLQKVGAKNEQAHFSHLNRCLYCKWETSAVQIPSFPFATTNSSARALVFMPVHGITGFRILWRWRDVQAATAVTYGTKSRLSSKAGAGCPVFDA